METTSLAWLLLLIQARQLVGSTPPLPEDGSGLLSWSQSVVPGVRELAGPLSCSGVQPQARLVIQRHRASIPIHEIRFVMVDRQVQIIQWTALADQLLGPYSGIRCFQIWLGGQLSRCEHGGPCTAAEQIHHINFLELKAPLMALQTCYMNK